MKKATFTLMIAILCAAQLLADVQVLTGTNREERIYDLLYDPTHENRVYALSAENHILVSNNNGTVWEIFYTFPFECKLNGTGQPLRLTADGAALSVVTYTYNAPDAMNRLFVIDIETRQILREIVPPNLSSCARIYGYSICEANNDVIIMNTTCQPDFVTFYCETFYTANGGETWNMIYTTRNDGGENVHPFASSVAVSPNNPNKLFITRAEGFTDETGGILISDNRGETWTEKLPGIILDPIAFKPSNPDDIFVATGVVWSNQAEGLYRSTNGGETWTAQEVVWESGLMNNTKAIEINPADPNHIVALAESEVIISRDNGFTWDTYHTGNFYNSDPNLYFYGMSASFNPFNANELLIGCDLNPFRSLNGGQTLTLIEYTIDLTAVPVSISLSANPAAGGSVTGAGTYTTGSSATVIAVASEGYEFVNWTEDNEEVSADAEYTFPVTDARILVANFKDKSGIAKNALENIALYPNPTSGELRIESGELNKEINTIVVVEIYDVAGRVVEASIQENNGAVTINISHLPAGAYFVKIGNVSAKVIKK
ncbi:MAG: T9SS type A sorting domain-containing protein [Cytophagaceae bacterium]|jgi:hypothetical protein|nr:T9SS type A sorting domain-containing protein [Cytophagaceae bacterium]